MRTLAMLLLIGACLTGWPREAEAQRRGLRRVSLPAPELGPRVGYDFDSDQWTVGGQFRVPGRLLESMLSGDYYLVSGTRPWQLNLDLALRLRRFSSLYAGGGIGIFHAVGTDVGPNLLVGLHPPARRGAPIRPYAEGRWTLLDGATPFRLVFGVNVVLGR